jgi:hypothetical protein
MVTGELKQDIERKQEEMDINYMYTEGNMEIRK